MKVNFKTIFLNYSAILLSMLVNLVLLPFIVKFLDSDYLGLWYVYISLGSLIHLLDFGFTPTITRYISYLFSGNFSFFTRFLKNNNLHSSQLIGIFINTSKFFYMTLSLFILVFFVIFGFSYLALISNLFDLNIFISWIIYSFAIQLNIFFSNYSSLLKSFNKIDELNFNNIISNIGLFSFSILFLFLGYGLIGLSLALFIKAILNRVLSLFQLSKFKELTKNNNFSHIVKNYKFIRDALNFIWPLLWKDGLISLSAYFSSQAVVLFSPFFLTLDQIATYSIGLQLFSAISSISSSMYRSLQTNIQYSFAKNDVKSFLRLTSLSNMIYIFLYLSGSFIFMVISEKFFLLLLDSKIYEIPLLVLVFLYVFIQGNHNMFCSFISNTNNLPYIKSYLISSLFGTFLSLLLISSFDIGPLGLVLGQIIPQLFYNGWYWVSYFLKNYNIKLKEFYFLGLKSLVKSIFSK